VLPETCPTWPILDCVTPSDRTLLAEKAERFRRMHHGPGILVLPNAWDAASARIFEDAGFAAIATTSAGVANSLGYPDGERVPPREMFDAVRRIVRAVSVPVTADLEAGYGDAANAARDLIEAGGIGLNLEDSIRREVRDASEHVERIRAVRRVAEARAVPLVINARTDVYLLEFGAPERRFEETVRRANLYLESGADCAFVPGYFDADLIGRLAKAIRGPLNILALRGTPPAAELERLGVARVSTGSGPMRASTTFTRDIARDLKQHGTFTSFTGCALSYVDLNRLLQRD
jgi:2-methylisocitrate lyase-like PEP mutase family enzyme